MAVKRNLSYVSQDTRAFARGGTQYLPKGYETLDKQDNSMVALAIEYNRRPRDRIRVYKP